MIFNESEYEYNNENSTNGKTYIKDEEKDVIFRIGKVIDSEIPGEYVDVYFISESGKQSGMTHKERYFTRKPYTDNSGVKKWGSFWKFKNLAIGCGLYEVSEDGKKHLAESFDSYSLVLHHVCADIENRLNEKDNKMYLTIKNERELVKDEVAY